MRDCLKFTLRCITQAWRGCWTKANEQAALLGGTILAIVLFFLRDWLREMNWIEAPATIWGTAICAVALAVGSVVLAFMVIFSGRLALAPARLYWEQHRRADGLEMELAAAKAAKDVSDGGPDWPIDELFFYISPDVLDRNGGGTLWDEIGADLKDKFSLSQIDVWGRPLQNGISGLLGESVALEPIEPSYWRSAHFTYHFFDNTALGKAHTYVQRGSSLPEYTDLQVNRAQATACFPEVSFFDATVEAYGKTRGTAVAEAAELDSDNPLKWFASYLIAFSKTPLYGNVPFSPKRERIDPKGFDPVMNANQIVLKERHGRQFWENITIKRGDLNIALEKLISWGDEV